MRIATFNINGVNKRLTNLLDWLAADRPDVVCLQELKCEDRAFPIDAIERVGYGAVWRGQRTWNGVAILARDATPVMTRGALPGDLEDHQARWLCQTNGRRLSKAVLGLDFSGLRFRKSHIK